MATSRKKKSDKAVQLILTTLRREYGAQHPKVKIEAYRYNPASIRIRIIDPDFHRQDPFEREKQIDKILDTLPDEVEADITWLLLLTPKERKTSPGSLVFDAAIPALL